MSSSLFFERTVCVECHRCGNLDIVQDKIIVIAMHRCTACGANGGKVQIESDDEARFSESDRV
jgi:hypothetical protein